MDKTKQDSDLLNFAAMLFDEVCKLHNEPTDFATFLVAYERTEERAKDLVVKLTCKKGDTNEN